MTDTYRAPKDGWVCFFCGERLTTVGAAREHFGAEPEDFPGCLIKVGRGTERNLLGTVRQLEQLVRKLLRESEEHDFQAAHYHAQQQELERLFGVRTVHHAYLKFEALRGENEALYRRLEEKCPNNAE